MATHALHPCEWKPRVWSTAPSSHASSHVPCQLLQEGRVAACPAWGWGETGSGYCAES